MNTRNWLAAGLAAALWGSIGEPAASPDYRSDPAVRAAVEQKLKTSDATEIRRRWGAFADLADRVWVYQRAGTASRTWFHMRWTVPGAVMEYSLGTCHDRKCSVRKAFLVHNPDVAPPGFSLENLFKNPLADAPKQPGFDVLWEDGSSTVGALIENGVQMDGYHYQHVPGSAEVDIRGFVYKAASISDFVAATGYVLPGAPELAKAFKPEVKAGTNADDGKATKPVPREIVPVLAKGVLRGGLLGAEIQPKDPERFLDGPQLLQSVLPDGPAAGAGLAAGDVIERIGEIERPTQGDVLRTILAAPGQVVPIVVQRNGQSIARSVKLGERTLSGPCFVVGLPDYQYDGECKDGFAHGRGELSYPVQIAGKPALARYSGDFARGYMEGRGQIATAAAVYEGELAGHRRHGRGKLTYADGRPGFEGRFANNEAVGLKPFPEAVIVCTRPEGSGKFECDTPQRAGVAGGAGAKGRPDSPQALLASVAQSCPSQRRLPSRTHLVWACGFGATSAPGAIDRGAGVEMRGRGSYQCLEREAGCKRTDPI